MICGIVEGLNCGTAELQESDVGTFTAYKLKLADRNELCTHKYRWEGRLQCRRVNLKKKRCQNVGKGPSVPGKISHRICEKIGREWHESNHIQSGMSTFKPGNSPYCMG